MPYIHELSEWPNWTFRSDELLNKLADVASLQGLLIGRLEGLGFGELEEAKLDAISAEVMMSSAIEGERLDPEAVRSSIARQLGMEFAALAPSDHRVEGVVAMALDAAENADKPLTEERLFGWHAALFPEGYGPHGKIRVANWRDDATGPMQVVSGGMGKLRVHYEAPGAARVPEEMSQFIQWFEREKGINPILKAGLAHFWFVTVHPYEDGNGRIGRAILDMALARADKRKWRCYSVSSEILNQRRGYYDILESTQRGMSMDVTPWLAWYLDCVGKALESAVKKVSSAIDRTLFWRTHAEKDLNERQRKAIMRMLMGWEGKMNRKKWIAMFQVGESTATRDLTELVEMGIFKPSESSGRSASYELIPR